MVQPAGTVPAQPRIELKKSRAVADAEAYVKVLQKTPEHAGWRILQVPQLQTAARAVVKRDPSVFHTRDSTNFTCFKESRMLTFDWLEKGELVSRHATC